MSSSGKKNKAAFEEVVPNYSLIDTDVYYQAEDSLDLTMYKIWRHGQIMHKVYQRRTLFYRPPNWLLIFSLGPTAIVRQFMKKTAKTMLRIHEDKQARRKSVR